MATKQPKILYFIDGAVPTPDNIREANQFKGKGAIVAFRNARYSRGDIDGANEKADGVLGAVIPESYKGVPSADAAIGAYTEAIEKEHAAITNAAVKGGVPDNNGAATFSDPGRRPIAAQTQAPGLTMQPAAAPTNAPAGTPGTAAAAVAAAAGVAPNPQFGTIQPNFS